MKTHLLFTKNFIKASKEIKALGGHITQKFTKNVFVANFPDKLKATVLVNSTTKAPAKLDAISTLMVKAWKTRKSGSGKPALKSARGGQPAKAALQLGGMLNDPPIGTVTATSEKMTGNIALGIIVVSGKDPWTSINYADNTIILNAIMNSCQFLATAGGKLANITFHYESHLLFINAVRNPTCSSRENCEAVFRDPALKQLGFQAGYQGCVDYVEALKTKLGTDWAYMAFATKYPMQEPGYAGGVRICLHYPEMLDYPSINTSNIFTRLSCNVFGAADEIGKCNCDDAGINYVPNYNCLNCKETQKVPCIMSDLKDLTLCPWTMGQLGWINPRPDSADWCMLQYQKSFQLVYKDVNKQVSQISWNTNSGLWNYTNLNAALPQAPHIIGYPKMAQLGKLLTVIYLDENNQFSYIGDNGSNLFYVNISSKLPQVPASATQLNLRAGKQADFVYHDVNSHISRIYYDGGTVKWYYQDINALLPQAAAPLMNPSIVSYGKGFQVIYVNVNGFISQAGWDGKTWLYADLHTVLPLAPAARSDLSLIQSNNKVWVTYWDENGRLALLNWDGAYWYYLDVLSYLPQAALPEGVPSMTFFDADQKLHIVYRDVDGDISNIALENGKWFYEKIYTHTRLPGSAPIGNPIIAAFNDNLQVVFDKVFYSFVLLYWNGSWNQKEYHP